MELDVRTDERALTIVESPKQAPRRTRFDRLYQEYLLMEEEQARQAGRVGYVSHIFVHSALPYRTPVDDRGIEVEHWKCESGKCRLLIELRCCSSLLTCAF